MKSPQCRTALRASFFGAGNEPPMLAPLVFRRVSSTAALRSTPNLAGRGALSRRVDGVNRLACDHKQPVALWTAEGHVAAYLRQPNPAKQFGLRAPHRDPTVAHSPAGIARTPKIAEYVGTEAIRTTMHAIDMAIGEHFLIRQLVVRSNIQDM